MELCCRNGAYVVIGDIDATRGEALTRKCLEQFPVYSDPALPPKPARSTFLSVDVTDYQQVVNLFDRAFKTYRKIDHVVVTAGSMETGENWFDQKLSLVTVREVGS